MLHFQCAVLGFLILIVESQYTEEDDVPKPLPEEVVLDLYAKYKEAVEDGHEEGVVTRRQLRLLNREFDIHVRKLKLVNGFKAHNLVIKENTNTGPLIYIDNPLESRVPHAYLTIDEFRKELEKRATRQRDKRSKQKQTEVYFEDPDVDFPFGKKDMRRKKVLGGAHIFEAKRTKSRYFEHTYMAGLKHGKKYHNMRPYHFYENRNLSLVTYSKLKHSMNHFKDNFPTTLQLTSESSATTTTERTSERVQLELITVVGENFKSIAMLGESGTLATEQVGIVTQLETTVNSEMKTSAEIKSNVDPEVMMESGLNWMNHHHSEINPMQLLGLRSGSENTTEEVSTTIIEAHNIPTSTLLEDSSTVAIILNVTKQVNRNSTIQFRANKDNETTNTEGDLTASDNDVTEAKTTTEVNEKTTKVNETTTEVNETTTKDNDTTTEVNEITTEVNETTTEDNETTTEVDETTTEVNETTTEDNETTTEVNETTSDDDLAETVMTTESKETTKDDDITEAVSTTVVSVKTKEQPVRPIWMRPRYKRITTTKTTTTRRTLGRPLVFMDG